MLLVSCEDKGLDEINERFCRNTSDVIAFLMERAYVPSIISEVVENKRYESKFDLITVKNLVRSRTYKGSRSRTDILIIQASLLAVVVAKYPQAVSMDKILDEIPCEVSERTLCRYIADWEAAGMLQRIKGCVQFTPLGEQTYIIQAQRSSLRLPS